MDDLPRSIVQSRPPVAGFNQFKKLIREKKAKVVYLAPDADIALKREVCDLCAVAGMKPDTGHTKSELGVLCELEVPCAVCVVPKEEG